MTKIALVTGANQGIGYESVKQLAQKGYIVYLGSRSEDKGKEAVAKLHKEGLTNVKSLVIDVGSDESVASALKSFQAEQDHLDVLINNAGTLENFQGKSALDVSLAEIKEVYEVNVFGVIRVAQAFAPLVKKSSFPIVLTVSSILGSITHQSDKNSPMYQVQVPGYNTSKAAVNAYTVVLASALPNAKVNTIHPGHVKTSINGYTGVLTPQESAEGVLKYGVFIDQSGPTASFLSYDGSIIPW